MADRVKLTSAQLRAMTDVRDHGNAGFSLIGRSAFGGLTKTCASLRRLGLFDKQNELTDAGRALLASNAKGE